MNCDWDSEEEETELFSSSLHIPIDQKAKKAYDEWIENECRNDWWQNKKEFEQIEREQIQRDKEKMLWLKAERERQEKEIMEID